MVPVLYTIYCSGHCVSEKLLQSWKITKEDDEGKVDESQKKSNKGKMDMIEAYCSWSGTREFLPAHDTKTWEHLMKLMGKNFGGTKGNMNSLNQSLKYGIHWAVGVAMAFTSTDAFKMRLVRFA